MVAKIIVEISLFLSFVYIFICCLVSCVQDISLSRGCCNLGLSVSNLLAIRVLYNKSTHATNTLHFICDVE